MKQGNMEKLRVKNNKQHADDDSKQMCMLKFKNFDSYMYGDHQLLYFVELRNFLAER